MSDAFPVPADISTGFPKNLAYNLKKLSGGFSKTKIKILPDNTTASANGIIRFRISGNGLYDFRSLAIYATASTSGTGVVYYHLPRYSSSLIQSMSITANNTTLCSINEYGFLYNALMDIEGGDVSQYSKRITELYDPSVKYSIATTTDQPITAQKMAKVDDVASNDTSVPICINNFLGFIGSLSSPVVNLSDWGDLYLNIQLAPSSVLWQSCNPNTNTTKVVGTNVNFTLDNIFLTIDRLSFQDALYYEMLTEKLLSPSGLNVGFYDYFFTQGSLITKSSGVALNFNVNSASLDQVIVSFKHENFNENRPLILYGANTSTPTQVITFDEWLANPALYTGVSAANVSAYSTNLGDGFNQAIAFMRSGASLTSSQFAINSVNIDPYPLTQPEIFNKVLQYTGFQNLDLGSSGLHPSIKSLHHFFKYGFVDICDLTNISGDNNFWICGLDGRGGGINIAYNATFAATNTQKVYPMTWCRSTRRLQIRAGRQLILDPPDE